MRNEFDGLFAGTCEQILRAHPETTCRLCKQTLNENKSLLLITFFESITSLRFCCPVAPLLRYSVVEWIWSGWKLTLWTPVMVSQCRVHHCVGRDFL